MIMNEEQEQKIKYLIDETKKAYEVRYAELHITICSLQHSVTARKSINEILTVSKDIYDYIKNLAMLTNNDLNIGLVSKSITILVCT